MDFQDETELADPIGDVRSVSISWVDGKQPIVDVSGCSDYEALGLLTAAAKGLKKICSNSVGFSDLDEEEFDDDDE